MHIDLEGCEKFETLPNIGNLPNLRTLNLLRCGRLRELPSNIGNLAGLEELDINIAVLTEKSPNECAIPESMKKLTNLNGLGIVGEYVGYVGDETSFLKPYLQASTVETLSLCTINLKVLRISIRNVLRFSI